MKTAFLAFIGATATAAALAPVIRGLAHRHGALDHALELPERAANDGALTAGFDEAIGELFQAR